MARAPQLHPIMRWIYILAIPGGILVTLAGKDPRSRTFMGGGLTPQERAWFASASPRYTLCGYQ